mgnify:CR=1 FL=1
MKGEQTSFRFKMVESECWRQIARIIFVYRWDGFYRNIRFYAGTLDDVTKRFMLILHLQFTSRFCFADLCYLDNGMSVQILVNC